MTTRQISDMLEDIYGFEALEGFISDVTDKIMPQIEEWQNRPLSEVYPVLIPWRSGSRSGMPFHRFLSFRPLWGKSSTPQMRSRAWMPHTENWIVSAAYFPAIQHYWRHSICQPLKPRKNGSCRYGTGDRSMVNWASCTKVGCPNKVHMNYCKAGGILRLPLTCRKLIKEPSAQSLS